LRCRQERNFGREVKIRTSERSSPRNVRRRRVDRVLWGSKNPFQSQRIEGNVMRREGRRKESCGVTARCGH